MLDGLVLGDDNLTKEEPQNHNLVKDFQGFETVAETVAEHGHIVKLKGQKVKERSLIIQNESKATTNSEVDSKFAELVVQDESKMYTCTLCNKRMGHKSNMKKHFETHMTGLSYDCQQCGKTFRSRNVLYFHKSTVHKHFEIV